MSFSGKVVLISGASSGIGADAARNFARLGAKVSIFGRNEERLNKVADEIKEMGCQVLPIVADVTKDTERIVNETIKYFGNLDVLVNNAGFGIYDNVVDVNVADFDRVIDTNLRSVIILTKLCVPHLKKRMGNIVNVSSVAGLKPVQNSMSYSISKAALDQFTKCSALDLAPLGIRVNAINPGHVRTDFSRPYLGSVYSPELAEHLYNEVANGYPVGRVGEVSDTSNAIAFLANNETASFINGALLLVDGGISLVSKELD
ncbi:uncharacterized protein LOC116338088 [Contarinia nasturtii]|uniref:uncharacterized protein LOC116338088 n=1 Tax=Contarinia nasturtii TaxID=265458 RepID=UPI0012D4699B|nr:uncharacterized protein LOC116338088 [Contarinia nasturtii]